MDGNFRILNNTRNVYVEVSFIGYTSKTRSVPRPVKAISDMGSIKLNQNAQNLDGVRCYCRALHSGV